MSSEPVFKFSRRVQAVKPSATMAMSARALELRRAGREIASLSVGEPDFPVFPHVAEELWTVVLGLPYSIHQQPWPTYDEAVLVRSQVTLVVQVNGKVRDQVVLDADVARDEARVRELVLELPRVQPHIAAGTVQRIIVVPGKLANIVVR